MAIAEFHVLLQQLVVMVRVEQFLTTIIIAEVANSHVHLECCAALMTIAMAA